MSEQLKRTCAACGGEALTEGTLADYTQYLRMPVTFRRKGLGIFSSGEPVAAYRCDGCGYLQLFAGKGKQRSK